MVIPYSSILSGLAILLDFCNGGCHSFVYCVNILKNSSICFLQVLSLHESVAHLVDVLVKG